MKLRPERLFGKRPLPAFSSPSQLKLSADGRYGSFLFPAEDDRERQELWLVDLADSEPQAADGGEAPPLEPRRAPIGEADDGAASEEDRNESERRRQFGRGVTSYAWHPTRHEILFPANGAAFLLRVAEGSVQRLTPLDMRQSAIRFSATGERLSYVRGGDLFCRNIASGVETRLTRDGGGTVSNGLADFIAQEEMHRFEGHWWAPDDSAVAFTRVDTAPIPQTYRQETDADGVRVVAQRYPFAGGPNAEVRLGMVNRASQHIQWLDWSLAKDDYLVRVQFSPDGALYVQAQSRDQKRLTLRRWVDGAWENVHTETSPTWINLHDNLTFLDDGRFLWATDELGPEETTLSLHEARGTESAILETGVEHIGRIVAADASYVWATGYEFDSTTQDIFQIDLNKAQHGLSREEHGMPSPRSRPIDDWRDGVVHPASRRGLFVHSGNTRPRRLCVLRFTDDGDDFWGTRALPSIRFQPRRVRTPFGFEPTREISSTSFEDTHAPRLSSSIPWGEDWRETERLNTRLTVPPIRRKSRLHPVILHVYGGPGVQRVTQEFPPPVVALFTQAGFAVLEVDNRGTANRGKNFEEPIHGRLGHIEVEDQLAALQSLRYRDDIDTERIGVFGHSYGGYLALMCLATSHVFRAGVAVAPVTDWTLYDTHYTERYLGTPQENPHGYAASSVLPRVPDIDAPLLLMHGMADDNVLFTHALKLVQSLQDAGKQFELMTYPGAKHALQERTVATHRYNYILDFFRRTLMD